MSDFKKEKPVSAIKAEQWLFMRSMSKLLNFVYTTDWTAYGYTKVEIRAGDFNRPDRKGHMAESQHYDRCAADLILDVDGEYITDSYHPVYVMMARFWKNLDPRNRWGGDFRSPDGNHFSVTDGKYA